MGFYRTDLFRELDSNYRYLGVLAYIYIKESSGAGEPQATLLNEIEIDDYNTENFLEAVARRGWNDEGTEVITTITFSVNGEPTNDHISVIEKESYEIEMRIEEGTGRVLVIVRRGSTGSELFRKYYDVGMEEIHRIVSSAEAFYDSGITKLDTVNTIDRVYVEGQGYENTADYVAKKWRTDNTEHTVIKEIGELSEELITGYLE